MSLPAGQQRVLDKMAIGLQESEPDLVSKFGIFTSLTKDEGSPAREQLRGQNRRWYRRAGHSRYGSSAKPGFLRPWMWIAVLGQLALVVGVFVAAMVRGPHTSPACSSPAAATATHLAHSSACPAQSGRAIEPISGK